MDARIQVPAVSFSDNRNNPTVNNPAAYRYAMPLNRPDLRLKLANRFMRMLRLHDHARDQLLGSHPAQPK